VSELSAFIHECLASGGLLIAMAATLFLPFLAWALTRPALALVRGDGAPLSRALVFALLATAPGISFALGTAMVVIAGYRAGCLNWGGGRAIVATVLAIFGAFVVRAMVRAYGRHSGIRMLRAASHVPDVRLSLAAQQAGVDARRVLSDDSILCLVGLRQPVVLVSDAALERLSEAELEASFAHERAHAQHLDQVLMALVAFFADLFPMSVNDLIERYRIAREFAADRAALRSVDALDLAQAIYRLSVPKAIAFGAALADQGAVARVRALLQPTTEYDDGRIVRNLSLLIAGQSLVAVTLVGLIVPLSTCRMVL
jgi:Zn-dependent protease with chaperone function